MFAGCKAAFAAVLIAAPFAAQASSAATYVYRGAGWTGRSAMGPFVSLLGRKPNGVVDFADSSSWANMQSEVNWAAQSWKGSGYRMLQAVPMLMADGGTLAQGAAGAYDAQFATLGQTLVAAGQSSAYIRIGWEFNGNWDRWSAASDPASFVTYYQRIVTAMRGVAGEHFKFIWNPALGQQSIAADLVYPGDSYVDSIGLDVYNQSWRPQDTDPATRWAYLRSQPFGLDWLSSFAHQHGKSISLPEWGTGTRPDGHGGGDDPLFIDNMAQWIKTHWVTLQGYWDYNAPDFNGELSSGNQPLSAAAYQRDFGTPVVAGTTLQATQASVPEPAAWLLYTVGFGLVGTLVRSRRAGRATIVSN